MQSFFCSFSFKHSWTTIKQGSYYITKETNGNIGVVGTKIKLPKLGLVPFAKSREVEGRILNATVRRIPSGKCFVSIQVEIDVQLIEKTGSSVGIDLGLKDFAILSNGTKFEKSKMGSETRRKTCKSTAYSFKTARSSFKKGKLTCFA